VGEREREERVNNDEAITMVASDSGGGGQQQLGFGCTGLGVLGVPLASLAPPYMGGQVIRIKRIYNF
jgi:hypothetical protein